MTIYGKHILRKDSEDKDPKVGVCLKCFRIRKEDDDQKKKGEK